MHLHAQQQQQLRRLRAMTAHREHFSCLPVSTSSTCFPIRQKSETYFHTDHDVHRVYTEMERVQ